MNLKHRWVWPLLACICLPHARAPGVQLWAEALGQMPLLTSAMELNRTNCVDVMLKSFRSNEVVKALIFMPGATDEFYMFQRAHARLVGHSPSLLDAVSALTNQTLIRASFRAPMLLLHTEEDPLEADTRVETPAACEQLRHYMLPHLLFNDCDWGTVQPCLKWPLKTQIRPWRDSKASWHFYRHSFAGWNLNGWEALEATALAGKSRFIVRGHGIVFEPDPRVLVAPNPPAPGTIDQ